jgi:signal transduction histidine kinase
MIALVENARRQKTPNEIALSILLTGLSVLFLLVVVTLPALYRYSLMESGMDTSKSLSIPVLVALLVCLIPTTIGGLLSAIGISGMNRLMQHNVMAASGSAIEAAGDIDVLLLDKTGTITLGNRMATDFIPADGVTPDELADAAQFSSLSDETPEGRSIVILAKERFNIRGRDVQNLRAGNLADEPRRRLYSEINIASIRLNRLIENLLNMSRLESGRTTPHPGWCDVHDLINKVAESLEQELHHFHLSIVIPEDMPLVYIDFGLIEQVLYNLLLNATQYAPAGSTIRAKFFYDNGFLTIQVMDRGPGFPESEIESIFYKFYRGKDAGTGGTGLGLSIVKGFVEAHQGTVIAENRKNGGALFTIKIPVKISDLNPDRIEEIT